MTVHFVAQYVPALAGLAVGALTGFVIATGTRRPSQWDARVTLPLVLAAGAAHLALIPAVEAQRQLLFGLYFAAMTGTFALGLLRVGIWKLGALGFPAGSLLAYFYFALTAHEADFIGLAVKVVEAAVIVAAVRSVLARTEAGERRPHAV